MTMLLHMPRLPRMGPLLILLVTTYQITLGVPQKRMINMDISGEPRRMVDIIPSVVTPNGVNYIIKIGYVSRYLIGMVRDGYEVLMDGDPTAMSRYILVHPMEDGSKYVRVITKWRNADRKYRTEIEEFIRGTVDAHYAPIIRTPIELDILSTERSLYINVDIVPKRIASRFTRDREAVDIHYSIKSQFELTHSIGVVRYGGDIVENDVNGLMERKVVWVVSASTPTLVITSKYNDGVGIMEKHIFTGVGWVVNSRQERKAFLVVG